MNIRIRGTPALLFVSALFVIIHAGCGKSGGDVPSLEDIPSYPNATEVESMEQSSPGGLVGGKLVQFTTTDSFDEVVDFYTDALNEYDPQFISQPSELGRQTAISIQRKKRVISVAIQEFTEEGKVNITHMSLGS